MYVARLSLALNGSSALQHFERGNTVKIRNGIMFDFYPGLPHLLVAQLQAVSYRLQYDYIALRQTTGEAVTDVELILEEDDCSLMVQWGA